MEEKKLNKRIVFSVVAVLLLIAVVAGATYAYFSATKSSAVQTVTTATMDLAFDDSTAIVNAANITPIYQSEIQTKAAKKSFTVTNNGTGPMYLQMKLTEVNLDPELKDLWFRWALYEEGTRIGIGTFYQAGTEVFMQQNMVLEAGAANAKDYDLYIWIEDSDENQNTMQGKTFSGKVTVNGSIAEYEDHAISEYYDTGLVEETGELIFVSEKIPFPTSTTTIAVGSRSAMATSEWSGDLTKFTNLKSLSINNYESYQGYCYKFGGYFPVSLEKISGFENEVDIPNFKYLSNLKEIRLAYGGYNGYCYNNTSVYLPRSLEKLDGFNCAGCDWDTSFTTGRVETHDFSNLVNLKTVSENAFGHLTSEDTVTLSKSIQGTVTIESGAFGSANVVYQ